MNKKRLRLTKGISLTYRQAGEGRTGRVSRKPRAFRAPSVKGLPLPLSLCSSNTATAAPRESPLRSNTRTALRMRFPLRRSERVAVCAGVILNSALTHRQCVRIDVERCAARISDRRGTRPEKSGRCARVKPLGTPSCLSRACGVAGHRAHLWVCSKPVAFQYHSGKEEH